MILATAPLRKLVHAMAPSMNAFAPGCGSAGLLRRDLFLPTRAFNPREPSRRSPFVGNVRIFAGRGLTLSRAFSTSASPKYAAAGDGLEASDVDERLGALSSTDPTRVIITAVSNSATSAAGNGIPGLRQDSRSNVAITSESLEPLLDDAHGEQFAEASVDDSLLSIASELSDTTEASSTEEGTEIPLEEKKLAPPPPGMGPHLSTFRLSPETLKRLEKNGITYTTEVQAGTFDLLYDGKDLIAKSRTGTGKTLAFALPILERLALQKQEEERRGRGFGPGCIVLAPTRELAKQVAREMSYIGEGLDLSVECFYGGSSYGPQEKALRRGFDVLVGTPGRIIDHLNQGSLSLGDVSFAVLDEADEMLSMGFSDDVEQIFEGLPPKGDRQVILFSATVPKWVKALASKYQQKDVELFDSVTTGSMAATTVKHCAVRVPDAEEARAALLGDIIATHSRISEDVASTGPSRAIVFTQTKREADELATSGALDGYGAAVLHGDVSQKQRESTLAQFRDGRFRTLVATDVAARGLDISGVDVVIQYRVPRDSDAYIHRAGRTGRAGKSGTAVVMYGERELRSLRDLEYECKIQFIRESAPAPEFALEAAVDFAMNSARLVDDRVKNHLLSRAEQILESPESAIDTVASLLAVAGRRTKLEDRSVLSGERGMRTVQVKGPRNVSPGLALRFLGDLARHVGVDDNVGLIRVCRDGSAVVDIPSATVDAMLDGAVDFEKYPDVSVAAATRIPPLREDDRRGGDGGRRGRGYDRRDSRGRGGYTRRDSSWGRGGNTDRSFRGGRDGYSQGRDSWSGDRRGGGRWGESSRGRRGWSESRSDNRNEGRWSSNRSNDRGDRGPRRTPEFLNDDF